MKTLNALFAGIVAAAIHNRIVALDWLILALNVVVLATSAVLYNKSEIDLSKVNQRLS